MALTDKELLSLFSCDPAESWTGINGMMPRAAYELMQLRYKVADLEQTLTELKADLAAVTNKTAEPAP